MEGVFKNLKQSLEIKLTKCTLRQWQPGDEHSLVLHANNYNIWKTLRDRFPHPYTLQDAKDWIEVGSKRAGTFNLAVVVNGAAVGGVGLVFREDVYRRSAEIGYWLGDEHWRHGIATEAVKAMTHYGFEHFDLCRIYAGVFETNAASARVLEKAGYVLEARLQKSITKGGKLLDELLYAIVKE